MVNLGVDPAQIKLQAYDEQGLLINEVEQPLQIPSAGKALVVLSSVFSKNSAYYEISSSQPIAITALRGDKNAGSTYWWENRATALERPEIAT